MLRRQQRQLRAPGGGSGLAAVFQHRRVDRGLRNRSLDFGADERLAIHARLVQPLLDITLLFLGLPLVLSRSNRNVFLAIGMCLALVMAFMLVVMGCQYLGSSYWLEPATGGLAAADDLRAVRRCALSQVRCRE